MTGGNTVGFAGLSHLGTIYSTAAAMRGFSVVGFDKRPELVASLSAGRLPITEPGLDDATREHRDRLRYTSDSAELSACPLVFIALDVSTDDSNNSDLAPLEALIEEVAGAVSPESVLVIMSQVPPGFCRRLVQKIRQDVAIYYQVETLIFGDALGRAVHPERYMVGCADPTTAFPDAYEHFLAAFECPILPMRYESAELCKIAINCFLVSTVSTANTLAEICENIKADWSEIVPALRLDKRIGVHAYLKPGLGIAGGNLERDLVTVQNLAATYGCDSRVVTAWQHNSAYARDWVLRRLSALGLLAREEDAVFSLWGLAYKTDTHSTKNSPALALLRALPKYQWQAFDPVAALPAEGFPEVRVVSSPLESARNAMALVVMTPWKQFASVDLEAVRSAMRGREIVDPYAALDRALCAKHGFRYHSLGSEPC